MFLINSSMVFGQYLYACSAVDIHAKFHTLYLFTLKRYSNIKISSIIYNIYALVFLYRI
jgi:hypothetical protein